MSLTHHITEIWQHCKTIYIFSNDKLSFILCIITLDLLLCFFRVFCPEVDGFFFIGCLCNLNALCQYILVFLCLSNTVCPNPIKKKKNLPCIGRLKSRDEIQAVHILDLFIFLLKFCSVQDTRNFTGELYRSQGTRNVEVCLSDNRCQWWKKTGWKCTSSSRWISHTTATCRGWIVYVSETC